ncbi:unnamed protein product (mitochondrion) [Plasmodiophora brassicae]|uniref:Reverse transcriptase RNase H-like domain-containing protein n=1 Tax=Plasmodiophora brassicae TaxID=37360 RepID=A0A3P3YIK2_PLABS|nr:unnamed protein product [Plasmodiophora brassicae]
MIGSGASAPVLAHFNPDRSCEVETDASDFAIAMVLSQRDADDRQRPLAFDSRRLTKEELNYKMHDKEMLAIVQSFEKWRQLLDSARHQTLAHSDHRDLEYFLSTPKLSRRQARWSESLGEFDFRIRHRPGRLHGKADALSRRPVHQPSRAEEETIQRSLPMLSPDHFLPGPLGHTISALRQEANREPLIERIRRQQATVARGLVRGSAGKRVRLSVKASRACAYGAHEARSVERISDALIQKSLHAHRDTECADQTSGDGQPAICSASLMNTNISAPAKRKPHGQKTAINEHAS